MTSPWPAPPPYSPPPPPPPAPPSPIGRAMYLSQVPLGVLLVLWVWLGRVPFGVIGWMAVLMMPFMVLPFVVAGLGTIAHLARTRLPQPRAFSSREVRLLLGTWAGLLVAGIFLPDAGDTDDSHQSLLTKVFGQSDRLLDVSWLTALAAAAVAGLCGLLLMQALMRRPRPLPVLYYGPPGQPQ